MSPINEKSSTLVGRRRSVENWKALLIGAFLLAVIGAACNGEGEGEREVPYTRQSANFPTDIPACQALNRFERYRYVYTYSFLSPELETVPDNVDRGSPLFGLFPEAPTFDFSQTYDGAIVNPDRIDLVLETKDMGDMTVRWVEGQEWSNVSGTWMPMAAQPFTFPPAQVCDAVMDGLDLSAATPSRETVGELEADHYRLRQVPLNTAIALWEAQSDMGRLLTTFDVDVWLTEDGWPARLEAKSRGQYPSGRDFSAELSLEISDVNSGDISIEPPTG
jgi:hypothetical protein